MTWRLLQALRSRGFFAEPAPLARGPRKFAATSWPALLEAHPSRDILAAFFPENAAAAAEIPPSGTTKASYLELLRPLLGYWRARQDRSGRIIDPYAGREIQYATPAFACAAALVARQTGDATLAAAALKSFEHAVAAFVRRKTPDYTADFYLVLLLPAFRWLGAPARAAAEALRTVRPQTCYQDVHAWVNWNVVNVCGEILRADAGLVADAERTAQSAYIEVSLSAQRRRMTAEGLYADMDAPMAYDAFTRLWLRDVLQRGAYRGPQRAWWEAALALGDATSLFLQAPSGEWTCGGRSGHHQWNEAVLVALNEQAARRWHASGRPDIAGAHKRAAHLAFASLTRWVRAEGDLHIVKNRATPALRLGFERYSYHSQYNLLTAAILCLAYEAADDAVAERPTPPERGNYCLVLADRFHKVAAASGGYYALIDTAGEAGHQATGLARVQRAGAAFSPLSDSLARAPDYGVAGRETMALAPGLQWRSGKLWRGVADFSCAEAMQVLPFLERWRENRGARRAGAARIRHGAGAVIDVEYALRGAGAVTASDRYEIGAAGVSGLCHVEAPRGPRRAVFPAQASDGATPFDLAVDGARLTVTYATGSLRWEVLAPAGVRLILGATELAGRNGFYRLVYAELPDDTAELRWHLAITAETTGGEP